MLFANLLSITSNPFVSVSVWIILLLAALYFARKPFHRVVSSMGRILYNAMRLTAVSVLCAEKQVAQRNREVLMAAGLDKRARIIEPPKDEHDCLQRQMDPAARMLPSSSLVRFFISGMMLAIAFGGGVISFKLIAPPLSAIVGSASFIGPYRTSDVAGLALILVELTMGLFLMESLRITRLFPNIASMDDEMRRRMAWAALGLVALLAGVESVLAFMNERLVHDMDVLQQTLGGIEQAKAMTGLIPTIGRMGLGFILPLTLTFAAIPLESLILSSRTLLGIVAAGSLKMLAFVLRLLGNIGYYTGRLIINLYDLAIFPCIWLESVLSGLRSRDKTPPCGDPVEKPPPAGKTAVSLEAANECKEPPE